MVLPRYIATTLLTCLIVFCSSNRCAATRLPKLKQAQAFFNYTPDPTTSTDTASIIPFTRAGNLIVVKATVDSIQGNFILDTGAPYLILNITYFRDYPLTYGEDEQTSITGSGSAVAKTLVKKFTLGSLEYKRTEADVINLGHLESSKNLKILGLLGMQLFRQCEMIIDYEKSLLYLRYISRKEPTDYKSEQLKDVTSYTSVPIDVMDNRIIAETQMAGKKLKLIIDSGAESNILDSRLPNKVFDNITITGRVLLSGTGNKKLEALSGNFNNMKIGNLNVGALPVLITNLEKTCFSYSGCIDGILGFDFLSLHKVGFNFVNNKMYIWK
jgi:predicted aspartyl protease